MKKQKNLSEIEQVRLKVNEWQSNPKKYCQEVLGVAQTWSLQDQLLEACPRAIKERKAIYVASGHSLGKDYICGAIGPWFLQTHRPSTVVLTGPTDRQVKEVMWKEALSHWNRRKIDLGGKAYVDPKIVIDKDWYLIGFTTKETGATKEGGGGKFQGFHNRNVCVIVTEAQSIEDNIRDQIDAITTNENVLLIFIGNPTRAKGWFARGLKEKEKNIVFNFSCLENPNYLERKEVIPGLASYQWVETMRKKWGEDDPRWISRVLGQVPDVSLANIFTGDLLNHAKERHGFLALHSDNRGVSIDPSGMGMDENVFMAGSGGEIMDVFTKTIMSPAEKAIKGVEMCKEINGHFIIIDCDGLGAETYSQLVALPKSYLQGIKVIAFHGSAPSEVTQGGRLVYRNMRAEAAFVSRDQVRAGKAAVNPKDIELLEDLEADEYIPDKDPLQIIPKEEIRESLGRSPGRGDAWKMLQWAFSKEFKDETYRTDSERFPGYAVMDQNLPRQAVMS